MQGVDQGPGSDQFGAAGVDEQRRPPHAGQVPRGHAAARAVGQPQMQRQHVGLLEEFLAVRGGRVAVGVGAGAGLLAAVHQHPHSERLAIAGDQRADLPVAPDAQRLAGERDAEPRQRPVGWRRDALLPRARIQVRHVGRQPAHGREDEQPGELGGRRRIPGALGHRDAAPGTRLDVDVRPDLARLADQAQRRQAGQQPVCDARPLAREHERFGIAQAGRELPGTRGGRGQNADVVTAQPGVAVEMADHVLVVVKNEDLHRDVRFAAPARPFAGGARSWPTGRPWSKHGRRLK